MTDELRDAWRLFLLEWEAAKHYHLPYALIIGHTFRNPLVEHLLPALLLVRGASILDEGLEQVIEEQGQPMSRKYRENLEGRISFLADRGALPNAEKLHRVRKARNEVAHDPDARIDWLGLESAISEIEHALTALGVVGQRPKLEYFGERSAMAEAPDGRGWTRTFTIGVRENGKPAYEATWKEHLEPAGSPSAEGEPPSRA
ncbi:MAG TPA: hypothetical protein VGR09_01770 [Gemmatimonadales bacterium]|nr:hypothetical protein [Gemmatimonadales bacterium]